MRHVASFASDLLGPKGAAQFCWNPAGDLLAASGARKKKVVLFDTAGDVAASFTVPDSEFLYDEAAETPVVSLSWHPSGSHLAVLPRGHAFAMVWNADSGEVARVDGGLKPAEVSALGWCPGRPALVLGTVRGGGVVYDCDTRAITPLALARHATKPVASVAWSEAAAPGGVLALGCKGGLLLLCRASDGALLRSVQLKEAVSQLQFCEGDAAATAGAAAQQHPGALLAANLGRRAICVWQLPSALSDGNNSSGIGLGAPVSPRSAPHELTFREAYGELEQYTWVHASLLVAGFCSGQVVAVSLNGFLVPGAGVSTELFSMRCLGQAPAGLAWCGPTSVLAAGGGCKLALLACSSDGSVSLEEGPTALDLEGDQRLAGLQYSPDGRLLTLHTTAGRLLHLLAAAPLLHGAWGARMIYVDHASSPGQALLVGAEDGSSPVAVPLPAQPELLALGPTHFAAAVGNQVWFQALEPDAATGLLPPYETSEFPEPVRWLRLNAHCTLLLSEGGRAFVAPAPGAAKAGGGMVELSGEDGEPVAATCAALADRVMLLGLADGLAFYQASDCAPLSEYTHEGGGITAAYPNADATMVLFQDTAGGLFLYNAVQEDLMHPPEFAGELATAVWDSADSGVVVAVNTAGAVHIYCHVPASVQGPGLKLVGTEAGAKGAVALTLHAGLLTWHLPDGNLHRQLLSTHKHLLDAAWRRSTNGAGVALLGGGSSGLSQEERLRARCQQALALCRLPQALETARRLNDAALLKEVALAALQFLEVPTALAAYEAAGDEEALAQLRPLADDPALESDGSLMAGYLVALTGGDADHAEQLLLASSRPGAAVELRRQLGHWERALELAQHLEPQAVGGLAALHAQGLEAEGQAEAAMGLYQQALEAPDLSEEGPSGEGRQRRAECLAGLARCSIMQGEAERGMELAAASGSTALLVQCAELLEGQGLDKQAGQLCALAGEHERAARLFLRAREFVLLDGVMVHAGNAALWQQYVQAKEDLGSFGEAARAYEHGGDATAAARVLLQRQGDAEAAAAMAARTGSAEASLAVARFCELGGKTEMAIEQYCAAGDCAAAFALARHAACVPALAAWARRTGSAVAAALAAGHFEAAGQLAEAAELCALAGQPERAARLYIQAGGDSVPAAVKLAAEAKDPAVAAVVLEHLQAVDSVGGALVDLHLALGNTVQACAVAEARAQQEQAAGNYKAARDQVLSVCCELQRAGQPATPGLLSTLHLVHCYLLVRTLVRQGDHLGAARLLLRVADGIAAFPKHAVAILTSTVIECHRAGLHGAAQRWAAVLQQSPYVGQVAAAYAKKIEAIARQPAWTEAGKAEEEPQCECLLCGVPGSETALQCAACQRALPFCAASGKRMALNDWSECPACKFPCRGRDLARTVAQERCCPLCEAAVGPHDVRNIWDPVSALRRTVFAGLLHGSTREGR